MNKKLKEILQSIKLSPEDTEKFGQTALNIIEKSEDLHDSTNNFEQLRNFLSDTIAFQEVEIKHSKKYCPQVFHENVALSREFEQEVYQKMLDELERLF